MTRPVLIILLVLALAGLYFTLQRIDDVAIVKTAQDDQLPRYTLNDALLTRYDADGTPSLRATAKTLEYFDDESAKGDTLNVDVLSGPKTPWHITSPKGTLPAHSHTFLLEGGDVVANGNWPDNNEPVVVRTTLLWVDPDNHVLHTDRGLTFKSVTRDGSATGMRSNWTDQNMNLLNDVKMHYEVNASPLPQALACLALLLAAGPVLAQATAVTPPTSSSGKVLNRSKASLSQTPSKQDLKPSGPVTITAKSAELVQGSSAVYTGDVVMTSNTLKLDGDRVELMQFTGGDYTAKVTGGPAHANHAGEGPDNPPLSAHAKTLNYDTRTGILDMIGDAYALRGSDTLTGETIRYIVKEHRIQAAGGEGRVTVIIQPRDDSTTAPDAPAATPPAPAPTAPAEKTP